MFSFSTEVTSSKIASDKPLLQRTLKAYTLIKNEVYGDVLEIGSGEGYGIPEYIGNCETLSVLDKSSRALKSIQLKHPKVKTINVNIPPLSTLKDDTFDTVISFQVIEHIKEQSLFLKEIYRVLKPGGKAFITTPNSEKTIVRNPWHYNEFNIKELTHLIQQHFTHYTIKGIEGNSKTDLYYSKNKASVSKFLKYDVFNIINKLPAFLLKLPYEITNRLNRNTLLTNNTVIVNSIKLEDYSLTDYSDKTLDFFCVVRK